MGATEYAMDARVSAFVVIFPPPISDSQVAPNIALRTVAQPDHVDHNHPDQGLIKMIVSNMIAAEPGGQSTSGDPALHAPAYPQPHPGARPSKAGAFSHSLRPSGSGNDLFVVGTLAPPPPTACAIRRLLRRA